MKKKALETQQYLCGEINGGHKWILQQCHFLSLWHGVPSYKWTFRCYLCKLEYTTKDLGKQEIAVLHSIIKDLNVQKGG